MRKQLFIAGIATAVGVTGLAGIGVAHAATATNTTNPVSGLVQELATKFNLKQADVQAVFDAHRTQMRADREADIKKQVAQLVTDGKLTQAQADKINAKRAEIEQERQANKDTTSTKSREEMKVDMDTKRAALETWAKDNGIDLSYLHYVMGGMGHGGMMGGPRD